tara:strand:- start:4934 stop:5665 length:732 start_codon:yes stop_codon:yes gene_type:complete
MAKYALIFYSHSDYSDAWTPMFEQTNRYFPDHKKYLFSDQNTEELEQENWHLIKYNDQKGYQNRVIHCLDQVGERIVMFHHEDMFLYAKPHYSQLDDVAAAIENGNVDIVKLICASYGPIKFENITATALPYIFENPPGLKFAIQPSLCNKNKLRTIYDKTGGDSIWKFEEYSSHICDYFNIKTGMTFFETDQKRGQYHWDSSIYPYFATAIVKGKWNFTDYEDTLRPILERNNVDYLNRGTC